MLPCPTPRPVRRCGDGDQRGSARYHAAQRCTVGHDRCDARQQRRDRPGHTIPAKADLPTVTISDIDPGGEVDAGQPADFQLTLSEESDHAVTVEVKTTPSTCGDYDATEDVLEEEIPAETLSADFTIETNGTFSGSCPAQITATIANAQYATATTCSATATVVPGPVANNDSYMTLSGIPLTVSAPGVLANDTETDNQPLTVAYTQLPNAGSLDLRTDGSFTYTPAAGYAGTDSFQYKAHTASSYSKAATVSIGVASLSLSSVTFDASEDHYTLLNDPGAS